MKSKLLLTAILLFTLAPFGAHAQVAITEIMYDLEGSDSGREWVEVYNESSQPVDLNSWKFFENDTNHGLTVVQGDGVLAAGSYAVIADKPDSFRADWPQFSGLLFDSSFSFSNMGEFLSLRNPEGIDIDTVTYSSDWGAAGDGNSLQFLSSWVAAAPTPGMANQSTPAPPAVDGDSEIEDETPSLVQTDTPKSKQPEFITADGGADRTVTVGAAEFFEAVAYKKDGSVHPYATFRWNFGNGVVMEGKKVLHQYNFPGSYAVMLSAITPDKLAATDRFVVDAKPAKLAVSAVTPEFIEIENGSSREIDLSLWALRAGAQVFEFPDGTLILPGSTLAFPSSATGLNTISTRDVALLYPNGQVAHHFGTPAPIASAQTAPRTTSAATDPPPPPEEAAGETAPVEALAAVSADENLNGGNNVYLWLLALVVLLVVTASGLLFVRAREEPQSEADQYKIIDESEK